VNEKRFPPPGNEVGYRDAAPPVAHEPEPPADSLEPARRHVIASRPDDPELALSKAATEDIARRQNARLARYEAWRRQGRPLVIGTYVVIAALYLVARFWRC
jgi:hypothetical protein